jgi:hypothetical protein
MTRRRKTCNSRRAFPSFAETTGGMAELAGEKTTGCVYRQ